MINLRVLGRVAWIIQLSPKCSHRYKRETEGHFIHQNKKVMRQVKPRCYADKGCADGGRGHATRNARKFAPEAGTYRGRVVPKRVQRESGPADTLMSAP